jgi:hypothetical protein
MAYATVEDVQVRMSRAMSASEQTVCANLLDDAAVIIDTYNANATADSKKVVSCRMVMRAIGDGDGGGIPMGATQGSQSGLGYSESWTIGSGSAGELYIGKLEKKLLGSDNQIGASNPLEVLTGGEL